MRDRAEAVTPTAAALVAAVTRRDSAGIEQILTGCGDLAALAVVLADNVGMIHDDRLLPRPLLDGKRRCCYGCRKHTRSPVGLCRDCADVLSSPPMLAAGRWVTIAGVARYVA